MSYSPQHNMALCRVSAKGHLSDKRESVGHIFPKASIAEKTMGCCSERRVNIVVSFWQGNICEET